MNEAELAQLKASAEATAHPQHPSASNPGF